MPKPTKTGFIYIWYDRYRKMYYLGCHWGTVDDGYICSSNRMRDAYRRRPQDFKRRILKINIERSDLLQEEHRWLSMIDTNELGKKYYNLKTHHYGHWSNVEHTNTSVRQKLSESVKNLHQDPEFRKKYLEGIKKRPSQSEESIKKRADSNRGSKRSEETKQKMRDAAKRGPDNHQYGKPLSDETKSKISISLSGSKNPFWGKKHDPELQEEISKKISQTMKGKRPKNIDILSKCLWWNNGSINKKSLESPGPDWIRGRFKKSEKI